MKNEFVLCQPRHPSAYRELDDPDGLSEMMWISRDAAEESCDYVQLIPYLVFLDTGKRAVMSYQRTKHGGEKRLMGSRSIGFGGHINPCDYRRDVDGSIRLGDITQEAIERELQEELGINVFGTDICDWGFEIVDESSPVSRVHKGLLFVAEFVPEIIKKELSIGDIQWHKIENICTNEQFEKWSQIAAQKIKEVKCW